ncbi:Pentatricopeptide repeat-containing protein [Forsythia ovata]|uniref:Pentatricopeptide repeat-containing protein n=1 Tax=Forsythia ovata TaxID=205694 RepID=A0ABD1VEG9_9LAMI
MEGKISDAIGLFKKIIGMGFQPCIKTWGTLIKGLCRSGNAEVGLRLLEEVGNGNGRSDLRFKPDVICYSTLIDGLCKEGLVDKGKQLYLEMKGRGIVPNVVTYGSLIHGLCEGGDWEEAKRFFMEMLDQGIRPNMGEEPDSFAYSILMNAFSLNNKIDDAKELFAFMEAKGHKPNDVCYNVLINVYCKCHKLEEAMRLFKEMINCLSSSNVK